MLALLLLILAAIVGLVVLGVLLAIPVLILVFSEMPWGRKIALAVVLPLACLGLMVVVPGGLLGYMALSYPSMVHVSGRSHGRTMEMQLHRQGSHRQVTVEYDSLPEPTTRPGPSLAQVLDAAAEAEGRQPASAPVAESLSMSAATRRAVERYVWRNRVDLPRITLVCLLVLTVLYAVQHRRFGVFAVIVGVGVIVLLIAA